METTKTFKSLGLDPDLVSSLEKLGYRNPTLIQKITIPYILQEKDLFITSGSGSGKTLSYLLPIFNYFFSNKGKNALIIVPTSKACELIYTLASKLSSFQNFYSRANEHIYEIGTEGLNSWKLLITTPIRASTYVANNQSFISSLKYLVIDDLDLIQQMELSESLKSIASFISESTSCILFSLSEFEPHLADLFPSKKWIFIKSSDSSDIKLHIKQFYLNTVTSDLKYSYLYALIKLKIISRKVLILVNSRSQGYKILLFLKKLSIKADFYSPHFPRTICTKIINNFNSGSSKFLIFLNNPNENCLAVTNTDFVIYFDPPVAISEYNDRLTGSNPKTSLVFCTENEFSIFSAIIKYQKEEFGQIIRPYDMKMLNKFKYRCEDILRTLTKKTISNTMISDFTKYIKSKNVLDI
jgi:superfamily II DNA/RNA helicase